MNRLIFILVNCLIFWACNMDKPPCYDLSKIASPVVFAGDSVTAYRVPAVLFNDNKIYLFFTVSKIVGDSVYLYTAESETTDLINWTPPRRITPEGSHKGFSGPGNVVRFKDEWLMCLHSFPRPRYTSSSPPAYADSSARVYLMRSKDLHNWSEPELMKVKGNIPEEKMGRMIYPYIVEDKDEPAKWWCFYKQDGVSMSYTYDFEKWIPFGSARVSENVCVLTENNEYILFNSPRNGILINKSRTLQNWENWGQLITLGQEEWEWARGRITAGTVVNLKNIKGIESYLMFFYGSGKGDFDKNCSIGIAWSKDLITWNYPK